jgi:hypothetical protein
MVTESVNESTRALNMNGTEIFSPLDAKRRVTEVTTRVLMDLESKSPSFGGGVPTGGQMYLDNRESTASSPEWPLVVGFGFGEVEKPL